jgi:hypothetical protein
MEQENTDFELNADLRNKLQTAITAIELMKQGKTVPSKMIETALKDLEKVLVLIDKISG